MHGHLVAVEVRVERVTDERVHLDRLPLDELRLERLDAETMQRRRAVQQHRMLRDDLLEDVPDLLGHRVDVLLRRLDVLHGLPLDEPAHDERLEELECHQLRQPALVQLQTGAGDDHRAAGIVDPLAEQVLAEPALLALEHVGQGLQRAVAGPGHGAAAAAVVEERVDGLLQHPLLVVDDDLGRAEVEQSLEAVIAVDDSPVEVVQVTRGKPAAVELHHRPQLRRNHRHGLEDHPLGTVLRRDERIDDLQALDPTLLLLALRRGDRRAQRRCLGLEVEVLEQVADRLRAHPAAEVDAESVRRAEAVLQLTEELLVVDDQLRLQVLEQEPGLLEPVDRVDRGLARVAAAGLDVEIHLADLQRPLDDRVEVLLADLPVRPEAEIVCQLADVLFAIPRVDDVGEQPVAEVARAIEVLHVDPLDELRVLFADLVAVEKRIEDAIDVLRDRALLRADGLRLLLEERIEPLQDLLGGRGDVLELTRSELAVVANRRIADELADLLRVFRRDLPDEVGEHLAGELACFLERRHRLLLGPVRETARPEVVVLVEALVLALREVVAVPLEPVLESGERLLAVDLDALGLGLHLVLEVVQVLLPRGDVDSGDDRSGEVQNLLELARSDVEQVADAARHALEEQNVRDRRGEVDVTHALATNLLPRHLDAAALADDPLVADALVLAAIALPVLGRT